MGLSSALVCWYVTQTKMVSAGAFQPLHDSNKPRFPHCESFAHQEVTVLATEEYSCIFLSGWNT